MSHEQVVHLIQVKSVLSRGGDVDVSVKTALNDPISQPPCCLSQNILEQQEGKDQREVFLSEILLTDDCFKFKDWNMTPC